MIHILSPNFNQGWIKVWGLCHFISQALRPEEWRCRALVGTWVKLEIAVTGAGCDCRLRSSAAGGWGQRHQEGASSGSDSGQFLGERLRDTSNPDLRRSLRWVDCGVTKLVLVQGWGAVTKQILFIHTYMHLTNICCTAAGYSAQQPGLDLQEAGGSEVVEQTTKKEKRRAGD